MFTTSPAPCMASLPIAEAQHEKGKENCSPSPQATVRQRMRLRSVEPK